MNSRFPCRKFCYGPLAWVAAQSTGLSPMKNTGIQKNTFYWVWELLKGQVKKAEAVGGFQ